ncbi:MAG: hypothetical protein ACREOW_16940 [Thermodesulfobacteriota bacterium]
MKKDVAPDPLDVSLFGALSVMFSVDSFAYEVKKFLFWAVFHFPA